MRVPDTYWDGHSDAPKVLLGRWETANLLRIAFLELDKYTKVHYYYGWRQWLEFFGNLPFSKEPSRECSRAAIHCFDSSSWTQEERRDYERIRIQENYDMTMETANEGAREEGLGIKGWNEAVMDTQALIRKMLSKGLSLEAVLRCYWFIGWRTREYCYRRTQLEFIWKVRRQFCLCFYF